MDAGTGFEPMLKEPKSFVLPLDDPAIGTASSPNTDGENYTGCRCRKNIIRAVLQMTQIFAIKMVGEENYDISVFRSQAGRSSPELLTVFKKYHLYGQEYKPLISYS